MKDKKDIAKLIYDGLKKGDIKLTLSSFSKELQRKYFKKSSRLIVMRRRFILFTFAVYVLFLLNNVVAVETLNGLTVESGKTKVIENQELIIEGDIIVSPNAKLIIRNSDVTVNSHYKNQYWVRVKENASLLIENSILREGPVPGLPDVGRYGTIENFRFGETLICTEKEDSRIIIRNSTTELRIGGDTGNITIDSSYCGIVVWTPFSGLKMTLSDSNVQMLHIWLRGNKSENIHLSNLGKSRSNLYLKVEKGELNVENTTLRRCSIALWIPPGSRDCRKNVKIENSILSEIFAVFPVGSNITLHSMRPGFYDDWNIYDVMNGSGVPWNLTLKDVHLSKWKLDFHGNAEIYDSEFHLDTWGNATVLVRNSKIVSNHHSRGGYIKFIDCLISDRPWHFTGVRFLYGADVLNYMPEYVYEFENTAIGPYAELSITDDRINIIFRGNLSMKLILDKIHWFGGTIKREYLVVAVVDGLTPLPNQTITLFTSDGKKIWERKTDEKGMLFFNLTFNKENYRDKFLLQTEINNKSISKEIGFLSDTPILLSMDSSEPNEFFEVGRFFVLIAIIMIITVYLIYIKFKQSDHSQPSKQKVRKVV